MRAAVLVVAALIVAGGAGVLGYAVGSGNAETTTVTETDTATVTETSASGLPAAVEKTRDALLAAAETGDYESLRPLLPASGFEYTFGGPVEGGPIAYWRQVERATGQRPLEILGAILEMPYVLSRGYYVWPWTYTVAEASDLSPHERQVLAPLGELESLFVPGTGYLGWRVGITPEGALGFFLAGD